MATGSQNAKKAMEWATEKYCDQNNVCWPIAGKHILAQFDEHSVVVYQAFCPAIAKYAVDHQRFGGDKFSFSRMSWIKTNFLWMMYRCGWASKPNQERVLAVRITREGFDEILSKAYTPQTQATAGLGKEEIEVRLQWDPDHAPNGDKMDRRAIQMGLKGETLRKYATEWIVSIRDVTDFVKEQSKNTDRKRLNLLDVAQERVYPVSNPKTAQLIGLGGS
ncbi:uncharacterized protein LOC575340 [Strongylocentrotus purpuratus]|uniref:DUF4291 domain-containing protein n=1 Tax=Strongylocentrotus purpuratus TaxID=7668 RepID=A0A7M7R9D1_STRPU|nr:uncharacterized protein LOC575340 [Strongylocentrotus purpuratus]|eukprot:XP_780840.1 PREDICTED: uncharacterized protein LOC575340 [Strongylocentrotus purpuratus]